MNIRVRSFAMIREVIGAKSVELNTDSKTIKQLLNQLLQEYPELVPLLMTDQGWNQDYVIALNKVRVDFSDLNATIKHGDEIAIIPPTGGG